MIYTNTDPVRRTGAHRSLEILKELSEARIRAAGGLRASRAVSEIGWQRAQSYAIQRDDFRTVWHAGHVEALITNGVDVIAGTQTGGVWLINSIISPTPLAGYTGHPLSETWDSPDISCLAWGPERTQVLVGTGGQAIFLLEFDTVLGGNLSPRQSTAIPIPFFGVSEIVTLSNPPRIVVATTTGVWWSPIPLPATNLAGYDWQEGQGLPVANFSGLAAGPGATVAAAKFGGRPLGIGMPPPGAGIYRGVFQGEALVFTESPIQGADPAKMRRTSLASCEDHPERMYAVAAGTDNMVFALLVSTDGGATWNARATPDRGQAGFQGFYNNSIAVSPTHPNLVVVGWLSGGPFWSDDGGVSWRHPHTQESNANLHNDLHVVCFARNPGGAEPLFIGGDGGIAVSLDTGFTYHSQFNRPLIDLQFYGGGRATFAGSKAGAFTASSRYPGLLAGGLQDNGNVYRCPDRHRDLAIPRQADTPWLRHVGGDGDLNRFIDALGVLVNFDNTNTQLGMALWDEVANRFPAGPGSVIPADGNAAGVFPTAVDLVAKPTFRSNGQLMYAATGSMANGLVHGLFADDPKKDVPEASNVKLTLLGFVGSPVTAIGSLGGFALMVGTDDGKIFSLDSASGAVSAYALPDVVADGTVSRVEVFSAPLLGALPDNAFALVGGRILYFNGLFWSTTTGTDWTTFAFDAETNRLFAATDGDVFVSPDRGRTWSDASVGLPARPHCTDLRIADDGKGGRDLYLATYGHSVWRATIAQRPQILELPPEAQEILIGVIEDGGGLVRLGKAFIKLPPRPLIRDLLAALVIENVAQSMSPASHSSSLAIRRTALQQIAEIALREANQLG
jgi:hypothetical protein